MKLKLSLFTKKEIWVPNRYGWLALVISFLLVSVVTTFSVHPFLSVNAPLRTGFLIVDGAQSDQAIEASISFFNSSNYEKILVTGGPVPVGSYHRKFQNYAEVGRAKLDRMGFADALVVEIPVNYALKDRTYQSALAVKQWLEQHGEAKKGITIFEVGPHARRSRLLYELALKRPEIGVVSIKDENYDHRKWWNSSIGFRTVVGECIAYLYVKLFFYPQQ